MTDLSPIVRQLHLTRIDRDLSQTQIAVKVGVHCSVVSRWENGSNMPPLPRLEAWAAALGYDVVLQLTAAEVTE